MQSNSNVINQTFLNNNVTPSTEFDFLPKFKPSSRGIKSILNQETGTIETYQWIQEDWDEYIKVEFNVGETIRLELGDYICKICQEYKQQLDKGLCSDCRDEKDPFYIRLDCMFNRETSLLNSNSCTKNDPACGDKNNAKYCHQKHVVYLGRYGDYLKVGTSRKRRHGTYTSRLVEQGLNEAIVMTNHENLEAALKREEWLKDIGFNDRLTFEDKLEVISSNHVNQSIKEDFYPVLKDLVEEDELEYFQLYADEDYSELVLGNPDLIEGRIVAVRGRILITEKEDQLFVWKLSPILHREILNITDFQ